MVLKALLGPIVLNCAVLINNSVRLANLTSGRQEVQGGAEIAEIGSIPAVHICQTAGQHTDKKSA